MDAEMIAWLAAPAGRAALRAIDYDAQDPLRVVTALRTKGFDAQQAATLATQARLREQARPRLGRRVDDWLFTDEGAQQVTRPEVARHRAERYRAAGVTSIVDLGCGLGSDLLALAAVAPATGIERDPITGALAALNVPEATVVIDSAESFAAGREWSLGAGVFADPARREGGRRQLNPSRWSPPLDWVMALPVHDLGVKVAPGIDHDLVPSDCEVEVVSTDGDVVEAALYRGALSSSGVSRRATVLRRVHRDNPDGGVTSHTLTDVELSDDAPPVGAIGSVLYEPDKAVIRAGLVGVVVDRLGGRLLDPTIAYVTADQLITDEFASAFATAYWVDDVLPFSLKTLRAALRAADVGQVTVKKRGSAIDPDDLRRQLRLDPTGRRHAVVVLTRLSSRPVAVLARPVESPS